MSVCTKTSRPSRPQNADDVRRETHLRLRCPAVSSFPHADCSSYDEFLPFSTPQLQLDALRLQETSRPSTTARAVENADASAPVLGQFSTPDVLRLRDVEARAPRHRLFAAERDVCRLPTSMTGTTHAPPCPLRRLAPSSPEALRLQETPSALGSTVGRRSTTASALPPHRVALVTASIDKMSAILHLRDFHSRSRRLARHFSIERDALRLQKMLRPRGLHAARSRWRHRKRVV
ncbi:hypothetical protein R3P38DRAFT_3213903 [Favolaschia claudopus]|uniref:Uncharacterized protein n=1 Tax=Favolaschia claudopus TaxID=2862362 RepID=A0AAW0ACL8_9AGAR